MRRRPVEDDEEQVDRGEIDRSCHRSPPDERRECSSGSADDDVLRRRSLQPAGVDKDVEIESTQCEQSGEDVGEARQQERRRCGERHAKSEDCSGSHSPAGNRTQLGARHLRIDVAIEIHVDRVGAARHQVSADHHHQNVQPGRVSGDEHRRNRRHQ